MKPKERDKERDKSKEKEKDKEKGRRRTAFNGNMDEYDPQLFDLLERIEIIDQEWWRQTEMKIEIKMKTKRRGGEDRVREKEWWSGIGRRGEGVWFEIGNGTPSLPPNSRKSSNG
jgi:hypothetical protein